MPDTAPSSAQAKRESLRPGAVIGGRFEVVDVHSKHPMGELWRANDQGTGQPIGLFVVAPGTLNAAARAPLVEACKNAAGLKHRSLTRTFGVGKTPGGRLFIAQEWTDGQTLSAKIKKRAADNDPFTLRGVYNVLGHLCKALEHAHHSTHHGAIRPSVVWLSDSGRVRLSDLGLGRALADNVGTVGFTEEEAAYLSPEVKGGRGATPQSDIFGLGAILYSMLTGRSPTQEFVAPSKVHPEADHAIDQILLKCLEVDPARRYPSAQAVREAMVEAVGSAPSESPPKMGDSIDVVLSFSIPPPEPKTTLEQQLANLAQGDKPRWLVTHDGSDHGPYSALELVEHISAGAYGPQDPALDMDSRERKPLEQWAPFEDFVKAQQWQASVDAEQRERDRAARAERTSGVAKSTVALAIMGAVLISVGLWAVNRKAGEEVTRNDDVTDLYKAGNIEIVGEADVLPARGRSGRTRRGGKAGGAPAHAGSYEAAMNRAVDLGDVTGNGDESTLSGGQVASTINKHVGKIHRRCVVQERSRGGTLGSVTVDLAIAGNGSVLGSSVREGSPEFRACAAGVVRAIRFPTFGAARMGARYKFTP